MKAPVTFRVPDSLEPAFNRAVQQSKMKKSQFILDAIKEKIGIQTDAIGTNGSKATVSRKIGAGHALGCKCTMCELASGRSSKAR